MGMYVTQDFLQIIGSEKCTTAHCETDSYCVGRRGKYQWTGTSPNAMDHAQRSPVLHVNACV